MFKPCRDWFIDYNDLATQSVPLVYTTGELQLTCDGAWPYSTALYKPMGVTRLWNATTNQFDFSSLSVGDEITLRFDISVTTSATNQVLKVFSRFDIWWFPYDLTLDHQHFKTADTYNIVETESFYIGSEWMRANPWRLLMTSDASATVKINWLYISVTRR